MLFKIKEWIYETTGLGSLAFYGAVMGFFLFTLNFEIFIKLFFGLFAIFSIALIIRIFYFKTRPENKGKKKQPQKFFERMDASSFPSVHSARVTLIGICIYSMIQTNLILFFIIISVISVGITRILMKKHDIYDVIAGLLIGAILGYLFFFANLSFF